ncbi:MAG: AmmeMemoRadiSam system protein B [Tannerellaceae bacterium]
MLDTRQNFAQGRFYSNDEDELRSLFAEAVKSENINTDLSKVTIIGGVVPHAGHIYCARVAVHFFEIVRQSKQVFDTAILINPNHTGMGLPVSIDDHQYWQTPFGRIKIDKDLGEATDLPFDTESQRQEHSGEVIVPYIQYFMENNIKLLPISFGAQNNENAKVIARQIYDACKSLHRRPLFIASSDFNHFADPQSGADLDSYALEALLLKDTAGFEARVKEKHISICGYGAILCLLHYAQLIDPAYKIAILRRGHSGEVHSSSQVVDYVSMLVYSI